MTAIAPAHTEFFTDESAIADAKGEIFAGLEPGGTAIVPFDSPHRDRLSAAAAPHAARTVTFGTDKAADVHAVDVMRTERGTFVTREARRQASWATRSRFPGAHWVSNSLAVLAAVDAAGGDLALAGLALAELNGLPGRGTAAAGRGRRRPCHRDRRKLQRQSGLDARDAERAGARSRGGMSRCWARCANWARKAPQFHADLAAPILAANVEAVVLVGEAMRPLADALEPKVNMVHVPDASAAREALAKVLAPGDAVLIKGSNGVGLGRVVAALSDGKR